jgi:hypothetical protein
VSDFTTRALVWLTYRLGATIALGIPLVLLIWSGLRRDPALVRLLGIYWKVASLLAISVLLLTDQRPIGYLTAFLAPLLMAASLWFWVDLNEELADSPPGRALPFTVRVWRWALTIFAVFAAVMSGSALGCTHQLSTDACRVWLEAPQGLHRVAEKVFDFVFGGEWTMAVAAFIGYVALVAYGVGLLQWALVRLPKQGRVAGDF